MNLDEIAIQPLTKQDLSTLMQWAANEGWNPGKNDLDVFWTTDPEGFYGCFYEGQLIAGGAIVSYQGEFGFMGLFIVHSTYRSHGIGKKLWHARRDKLISRLSANAPMGMDGVVRMQPFYQRGGFQIAFRDERYEFIGRAFPSSEAITPIEASDIAAIMDYDLPCFGCARPTFLRAWLTMSQSKAFKYQTSEGVGGYAVIRKAEKGYKIGPLFADNETIAATLLQVCLNEALGESVFLDIPTIHSAAVRLVAHYGGSYVFECARMYLGTAPDIAMDKVYGITSFELG